MQFKSIDAAFNHFNGTVKGRLMLTPSDINDVIHYMVDEDDEILCFRMSSSGIWDTLHKSAKKSSHDTIELNEDAIAMLLMSGF